MAKEWLISITGNVASVATTVWLTKDGTNTGARCRTETPELDSLFAPSSGNTTVAAGGSPWTEKPLANGGGRKAKISFQGTVAASGLYSDLKELFDDADANNGSFTVTFANDMGSISVLADPDYDPVPIGFNPRSVGGRIRGLVLRLITKPNP
jgi:hypothetical protein